MEQKSESESSASNESAGANPMETAGRGGDDAAREAHGKLENAPQAVRAEAEVEKWEDESEDTAMEPIFGITPAQKFDFAKKVLVGAAVIFVVIAALRMLHEGDGVQQVWSFASVALNSIVALILGYYFGRNE